MKVYLCGMCNSLYIENRPMVCVNCNSNVLIKEYESSEEEIEELKKIEGIKLVENFESINI